MSPPSFGQRVANLLRSHHPGIELVLPANAWAALAVGAVLWLQLDLAVPWALATAAAVFVGLSIMLLYRATFWISAVLGSACIGGTGALFFGLLGAAAHARAGPWIGGLLGFGAMFAVGGWAYHRVSAIAAAG